MGLQDGPAGLRESSGEGVGAGGVHVRAVGAQEGAAGAIVTAAS